ncbi:hypothetical protein Taro_052372 [Colocasia esculenta]|uniref:Uncharacterized protein n=1 Tax=Colocasia esculenta TaxID=4460 RepID=A0A843XJ61_COLES|nr:hypothetical protein [Colocasia esculenta]
MGIIRSLVSWLLPVKVASLTTRTHNRWEKPSRRRRWRGRRHRCRWSRGRGDQGRRAQGTVSGNTPGRTVGRPDTGEARGRRGGEGVNGDGDEDDEGPDGAVEEGRPMPAVHGIHHQRPTSLSSAVAPAGTSASSSSTSPSLSSREKSLR